MTDTIMEKEITSKRLVAPVSLPRAAAILQDEFPKYAFTENQLRQMCINRSIPYMEIPRGGRCRKVTWVVRIADLVRAFRKMEVGR